MIILGIETSCDDTSAAIIKGPELLSNIISTQLIHQQFGGIVPELASRSHIQMIGPVLRQALDAASLSKRDIQGIAVTYGPGLAGSLLVGLCVAKGLSISLGIPMVGINHLEGHIWANKLSHPTLEPPFITLIVSGGHTQTVYVKSWREYQVLGRTRDDAAGEAFDKVAKLLKLGFPGGPVIEKLARENSNSTPDFPRAMMDKGNLDFSFSGLKTAVLNHTLDVGVEGTQQNLSSIASGFQEAVVDVLVEKTIRAAKRVKVSQICIGGGVAVNKVLQRTMKERGQKAGLSILWPEATMCMDNGAMIALAGYDYLKRGETSPISLSPVPSLNL